MVKVLKSVMPAWRCEDDEIGYYLYINMRLEVINDDAMSDPFALRLAYHEDSADGGVVDREHTEYMPSYEHALTAYFRLARVCGWMDASGAKTIFGIPDTPPFGWTHLAFAVAGVWDGMPH